MQVACAAPEALLSFIVAATHIVLLPTFMARHKAVLQARSHDRGCSCVQAASAAPMCYVWLITVVCTELLLHVLIRGCHLLCS